MSYTFDIVQCSAGRLPIQILIRKNNKFVAVEVRKRTLYRKLILRKWRLKFSNDFDVIVDVVLDCLVYACKTFTGHSARLCFTCVDATSNSNSGK